MKIIETVVLVLIAGILNFANVQSVTDQMQEMCTESGGPEAYEAFKISFMDYKNCTSSLGMEILQELPSRSTETIDSVLIQYCSQVEIFSDCIRIFIESAKPCLGPIPDELVDLGINSTYLLLQFPCENRKLMKDLITSTDESCLTSKLGALEICGNEFFMDSNETSSTAIPNLRADEIHSLESDLDIEICNGIQKFEQCTVTALTGCTDQIFATALDSLYKYFNREIPCANLPKSQKPVASPGSSAGNVL